MKHFPFSALIIAIVCLLAMPACDDDEVYPVGTGEADAPYEFGETYLLESSIDKFPYQQDGDIVFVNEDGDEVVFTLEVDPITQPVVGTWRNPIFDNGQPVDTVYYSYGGQRIDARITAKDLDIEFLIQMATVPWIDDLSTGGIADILSIGYVERTTTVTTYGVFSAVVDQRTWPIVPDYSNPIPETVTILGRTFNEAMADENPYPGAPYPVFNYEFGVISFSDHDDVLWRYDRFE